MGVVCRREKCLAAICCLVVVSAVLLPTSAHSFPVDRLPADNLVVNPWFRNANNPTEAGFSSWTNVDNRWVTSQKITNPTSDLLASADCNDSSGTSLSYCGTAAKLAADDGNAQVGVDSYLYQVISANPANTRLKFFNHWVAHFVDPFEVNIYGGDSSDPRGTWILVWTPLRQQVLSLVLPPPGQSQSWLWEYFSSLTPPVETVIPKGYPYYKLEIHAKLPKPDGFKVTGVFFGAAPNEPAPTPIVPTRTRYSAHLSTVMKQNPR